MSGVAFLQLVCAVYVQLYRLAAEHGNTQRGPLECAARVKAKQRWIGRIPTPPLDPRPLSSSPSFPPRPSSAVGVSNHPVNIRAAESPQ